MERLFVFQHTITIFILCKICRSFYQNINKTFYNRFKKEIRSPKDLSQHIHSGEIRLISLLHTADYTNTNYSLLKNQHQEIQL